MEQKPSFKEAQQYISKKIKELQDNKNTDNPISSFNGLTREVIIKSLDKDLRERPKIYTIPRKEAGLREFCNTWIEVFLGCLDYYKQKLLREGIVVENFENKVLMNGIKYEFENHLDYINKLEEICLEIEKRKKGIPIKVDKREIEINGSNQILSQDNTVKPTNKQEPQRPLYQARRLTPSPDIRIVGPTRKEPTVTRRSVSLEAPKKIETKSDAAINNGRVVQPSISGTYSANYKTIPRNPEYDMTDAEKKVVPLNQITQENNETNIKNIIKSETPKVDIVEAQKEEMKSTPKRVKVDRKKLRSIRQERINLISLDPEELLSVEESKALNNVPLVLIPVSLIDKTENMFYDNIEMIKKYAGNTKTGALLLGKVTTMEKVAKETSKIMRLCNGNINYPLICYEVNNDKIKGLESEELIEAFNSIQQTCDVLTNEGYKVLMSADLDVKNKFIQNRLQSKYPLLARISPKELNTVDENTDIILMDPMTPNDEILLTRQTAKYLVGSSQTKEASSFKRVA